MLSKKRENAETYFFRAQAYFAKGCLEEAIREIKVAVTLAPKSRNIKLLAAQFHYFGSLVPSMIPKQLPHWPLPVPEEFIRTDNVGRSQLNEATELFKALIKESAERVDEQEHSKGWLLACLACSAEGPQAAKEVCESLLEDAPANFCAIPWALARGIEVDWKRIDAAHKKLIKGGDLRSDQVVAVVQRLLTKKKAKKALAVLSDYEATFEKEGSQEAWAYWQLQALVSEGTDPEKAIELVGRPEQKQWRLAAQASCLRKRAALTGDFQDLAAHLEKCYSETGEPAFLAETCETWARLKAWARITEKADKLVELFPTPNYITLAAIALYNQGQYQCCRGFLEDKEGFFAQRTFPPQIKRILAGCDEAEGHLPKAIERLEQLSQTDVTTEDLLSLSQLYFRIGDIPKQLLAVRQLQGREDLSPEAALVISHQLTETAPKEAEQLWRKALQNAAGKNLAAMLLAQGYALGRDEELGGLAGQLSELAGDESSGIKVLSIREFSDFMSRRREHLQKTYNLYRTGQISIHMFESFTSTTLARYHHALLAASEGEADPIVTPRLYIRHGGRAKAEMFTADPNQWRLCLDITAVLLAHHLGLFRSVLKTFDTVWVADETIPCLEDMRRRLLPGQPSVTEAQELVISLAASEKFEILDLTGQELKHAELASRLGEDWVAMAENVLSRGGLLVDWLPLHDIQNMESHVELPDDLAGAVISPRTMLELLNEKALLSGEQYNAALERLGKNSSATQPESVDVGSRLILLNGTAHWLAATGVFEILCKHFRVILPATEMKRIHRDIISARDREELAHWVQGLIEELNVGIREERVRLLPALRQEQLIEGDHSPSERCLFSVVHNCRGSRDAVWVEDRFINGFASMGEAITITIEEVLDVLRDGEAISEAEFYEKRHRLRAGNACFLPLCAKEIAHYIKNASIDIQQGVVRETQELTVLRKYAAAALLHSDELQRAPMPKGSCNPFGEQHFILSTMHAVAQSLLDIWVDEGLKNSEKMAALDWVLTNLYLPGAANFILAQIPIAKQPLDRPLAITDAGLIAGAIGLQANLRDDDMLARKSYLDWVFERLVSKHLAANPGMVETFAQMLKGLILAAKRTVGEEIDDERLLFHFFGKFYEEMPDPIREILSKYPPFLEAIGVKSGAVAIGGEKYFAEDFWKVVGEAIRSGEASILPTGPSEPIVLKRVEKDGILGLEFVRNGEVLGESFDARYSLFSDSLETRRRALLAKKGWFDLPVSQLHETVDKIIALASPHERVSQVESWHNASASVFYGDLFKKLRDEGLFCNDDLCPPDAEALARHLSMPLDTGAGDDFISALNTAAENLCRDEGLFVAILRLSGMPVTSPQPLLDQVKSLSAQERGEILEKLARHAGTPVSRIHFLQILATCPEKRWRRLACRVVRFIVSETGALEIRAFAAVLKWVNERFGYWRATHDFSPQLRLALVWAHANELFMIFRECQAASDWLRKYFGQQPGRIPFETFEREPDYWNDVAHPRQVRVERFVLLSALTAGVGSEIEISPSTKVLLTNMAITEIEEQQLPNPVLMQDVSRAGNVLGSLLATDLGDRLGDALGEDARPLDHSSLRKIVEQCFDILAGENPKWSMWAHIFAVLGDWPIYDELRSPLENAIVRTDFAKLVSQDQDFTWVLPMVSSHAISLKSAQVQEHLTEQLMQTTKALAEMPLQERAAQFGSEGRTRETRDLFGIIMETALNISLMEKTPGERQHKLAELIGNIVGTWPEMAVDARSVVQRFVEELPVDQGQHFWRLLVKLRSK